MRILSLLLILTPFFANAQQFVATPEGLRDAENTERSFLVFDFPGKTSKDLYDITNKFIQVNYVHPDNIIKGDFEGEYLRISTFSEKVIFLQKGFIGDRYYADIRFLASFEFRDGRMKFEIDNIFFTQNAGGSSFDYIRTGALTWGIFDKKGKPVKDFNIQLENYFNKYVSDLLLFINKEFTIDDDW